MYRFYSFDKKFIKVNVKPTSYERKCNVNKLCLRLVYLLLFPKPFLLLDFAIEAVFSSETSIKNANNVDKAKSLSLGIPKRNTNLL